MSEEIAKLTKNQRMVFDTLDENAGPLSAYDILDRLRSSGLKAPPQVYRALDKLMEFGLVHRLESLNAFVACAHPHCHELGMTAFAICDNCGRVSEFSDNALKHRLKWLAEQRAFRPSATTVEIRGLCGDCSSHN